MEDIFLNLPVSKGEKIPETRPKITFGTSPHYSNNFNLTQIPLKSAPFSTRFPFAGARKQRDRDKCSD